jgi:hypothetical protein
MTMASYAVYDTSTGEVVHVHVEPAELDTSPEEILQLADPSRTRSLDVLPIPREGLPIKGLSVVDGKVRATGDDANFGAAGGGGGVVEPAVTRRYEVQRPGGSTSE